MIINHNIAAMGSYRSLTSTNNKVNKSLERLSSGLRINKAGDDAAGLAISEGMRAQIRGLKTATRNSQDAISLIQTGEGALNEVHSMLQRMRELAVQAVNGTNSNDDRSKLNKEIEQLKEEIDSIAKNTKFNGINLLSKVDSIKFQVGANKTETIKVNKGNVAVSNLKISTQVSIVTAGDASKAISAIDSAISKVSETRARFGSAQNRLEHTINNLKVAGENLQAAESRIRDLDMAAEMVNFSKNRIIAQSGTAMLAQANVSPQGVLQLL